MPSEVEENSVRPSGDLHFRDVPEISWTKLMPGLELGECVLPESKTRNSDAVLVILRIDPELHDFSLSMASESGEAKSLPGWSSHADLRAGINAAMYLPDNITSTGYMRKDGVVNNSNIGARLGAFFVAGNKSKAFARADIIEREGPGKEAGGWKKILENYSVVVQNYRLVNSVGQVLWPEGGQPHSIAVVAKDSSGRILFILCQEPLTPGHFARRIKSLPLSLGTVMYVEGGAQAGIFVRVDQKEGANAEADGEKAYAGATAHSVPGGIVHVWKGRQSLINFRGSPDAPLPNIIGVAR